MVQLADRLVGRAAELEVLDRAVADLADGHGSAISVVGAPGIGKSRLIAELATHADAKGHLVLSGSASELERGVPFGVFVDAIDEYVETVERRRLERLEADVRTELARVFPSLASFRADGREALQNERYRAHRAVRTLLETLATNPLVLVLDDFHWADSASSELAAALLRRPPAARVLIVLGFRPHQLPHMLRAELSRGQRSGALTEIDLGPLSLAEAEELLGGAASPSVAAALFEESGGVPFYLEQLARVMGGDRKRPAGTPEAVRLGDAEVPPMVAAALTEELSQLSEDARAVLRGAAVAGDPFEPELAAAAAGVPEPKAIDALDELLGLEFVRSTDVPRRFRFRHPLVRRAVYEASPAGWRLTAHERSADLLAARGASVGARAHHVERSARQGNAAAVALLREAGDQAAERAPGTAARWYAGALRLLPDTAAPEERVGILLARAQALAAVGRLHDSHAALEQSLELTPSTAGMLRTRLTAACAGVERYLGRHERAHERLTRALGAAPSDSPEAVALVLELANDAFYRLDFDAMVRWSGQAADAAEALGDRALAAAAHAVTTLAGAWAGTVAETEPARVRATSLVDALSDAELAARLDAAANLASAELSLAHFPEAGRHAERALALARATGQTQLSPPLYGVLGSAWSMDGRLAEAAELLQAAEEAARLLDEEQGLMWTLSMQSSVALLSGDLDTALDTAREAFELTAGVEQGLITAWAALPLARVLVETGEHARAAELILTAAGGEELVRIPAGWRTMWLEVLVRARLGLGDSEGASRSADIAEAWAAHVGLPYVAAMAHLARARIRLSAGDPAGAVEPALVAAELAASAGARVDAALARTVAGRALGERGDRERAVEQLALAAEDFARFGAARYRVAVEREMRRLGARVASRPRGPRPAGDGIEALTARELEIARLTVARMTNREIGGRLFLSEKTIETHMRNIFHKLGVTSRIEVARATERADQRLRG